MSKKKTKRDKKITIRKEWEIRKKTSEKEETQYKLQMYNPEHKTTNRYKIKRENKHTIQNNIKETQRTNKKS